MKRPESTRKRFLLSLCGLLGAGVFSAVAFLELGKSPVERPGRPGSELVEQLAALRGANDLARSTTQVVGDDPSLYPTAYQRLEVGLGVGRGDRVKPVPPAALDELAGLARRDVLDTPAWRAYYVCLALSDNPASVVRTSRRATDVLTRAGIREAAQEEASSYVRKPSAQDDHLTSLATRAAFVQTLTCLGQRETVPATAWKQLSSDAAQAREPAPVLQARDALTSAGRSSPTLRVLDRVGELEEADCARLEPVARAALSILSARLPPESRACLRQSLRDEDPQTRWLSRRALLAANPDATLPSPTADLRPDGLGAKAPRQLGTLTATYDIARALTASGRWEAAPEWLKNGLRDQGGREELDGADQVLLALSCHRLHLDCGPQADKGVRRVGRMSAPVQPAPLQHRAWHRLLTARAELELGCPDRTDDATASGPESPALKPESIQLAAALGEAGCRQAAAHLVAGVNLVGLVRAKLSEGDLLAAGDALQAALATNKPIPQALHQELPSLLARYRNKEHPALFSERPGGPASARATRAAYHLLA
ncbi:hypothetical protein KUG12_02425 [Streptomyces sp. BV333]|uniref:hypothetical protein n=1 Tax=Streptomyces sp. BV333 TaxID=2849673 RepID=UPI001C2DF7B4|nr:hypothetical protein [Streptomyces sp. BV333]MBV1953241.1 hypothetical protein [Streptomyces sp. BV333]